MAEAKPYGLGTTDYEKYVRTEPLLALQKRPEERVNEDELLFQVTHQSAELWMKVAAEEVLRATRRIDDDDLVAAAHGLLRTARILEHLAQALPILETMSPRNYHQIRMGLGRGSGQESPGFNRLLDLAPPLGAAIARALERRRVSLLEVQRDPDRHGEPFRLVAAALAWDEAFQLFRWRHYALVRRIIGNEVLSLKGVPASQLAATTTEPLLPDLWKPMNALTREWKPEY